MLETNQIETNNRVGLKLMEARMRFLNELNIREMIKKVYADVQGNVEDLVDKSVKRRLL